MCNFNIPTVLIWLFCWNVIKCFKCWYTYRIPDIRSHRHSIPRDFWQGRTFVLTSNDHPGHSCSHQMTTPDIRAHIKWTPRTFVLISNYHPGHSCSYQLHFIYLIFTCFSPPTNRFKFFKKKYKRADKLNWRKGSPQETRPEWINSSLGFIEAVHQW